MATTTPFGVNAADFGEIPGAGMVVESAALPEAAPDSLDSLVADQASGLYTIANGGEAARNGHAMANATTQLLQQGAENLFHPPGQADATKFMEDALTKVGNELRHRGETALPGTEPEVELSVALIGVEKQKPFVVFGRAGDVGAYVLRGGSIYEIADGTDKPLGRKEEVTGPLAPKTPEFDVDCVEVQKGDKVILVSKAIFDSVGKDQIKLIASGHDSPGEITQALQDAATVKGHSQNRSALAVVINEVPTGAGEAPDTTVEAMWAPDSETQRPVHVTGYAGERDGIHYYRVAESDEPIPEDEIYTAVAEPTDPTERISHVQIDVNGKKSFVSEAGTIIKLDPEKMSLRFYNSAGVQMPERAAFAEAKNVLSPAAMRVARKLFVECVDELRRLHPDMSDKAAYKMAMDKVTAAALGQLDQRGREGTESSFRRALILKKGKFEGNARKLKRAARRAAYVHKVEHRYEKREARRNVRQVTRRAKWNGREARFNQWTERRVASLDSKLDEVEDRVNDMAESLWEQTGKMWKGLGRGAVRGANGVKSGVKATGRRITNGAKATGRGIKRGGKAAGRGIAKGAKEGKEYSIRGAKLAYKHSKRYQDSDRYNPDHYKGRI